MCSRFHSTFEFQIVCTFKLGFSRDRTSPCPFVLGQKSFLFPLSLCPGTRAVVKIPGQDSLSRNVPRDKITLFGLSVGHFASFLVSRSVNLHPFCIIFGQLVSRSVSQFFSKMFLIFFLKTAKLCKREGHFGILENQRLRKFTLTLTHL